MARKRSDSTTQAVAATQAAISGPIKPPAHIHLRDRDWPFWEAIVLARAADTWNPADLALAANLARCQADIDRLQGEIDTEGDVLKNAKGTPVVNPKHALMETFSRRAVALSRAIHVHAEATQGRSRDAGNKLGTEKGQRAAVGAAAASDDASLIPGLGATLQ
jgi:hypothetical protein